MQDERIQKLDLVRRNRGARAIESRGTGSGGDQQGHWAVVPYAAGGPADVLAPIIAEQVGRAQGPTIVVENRPGASTLIGTEAVARATPDGNTILMQGDNIVINAILHPSSVTYNPLTSFDPICLLTNVPQVLVVNSSSAFHSLADFLAAAKTRPRELIFASFGPGSSNQIMGESLRRAAKVDWTYVPYPDGDVPVVTALLGGHVMGVLATYPAVMEQVTSGTLRPLAVAEPVRIPQLPDVPTIAESRYEGFAGSAGFKIFETPRGLGAFAPAGTPKEVIAHLSTLLVSALKAPEVKSKLPRLGLAPVGRCGADFAADVRKQPRHPRSEHQGGNEPRPTVGRRSAD